MRVTSSNLWAREYRAERNSIRQLLVPACSLDVIEGADGLWVSSLFGRWPATRSDAAATTLTARLPTMAIDNARVRWIGDKAMIPCTEVRDSYQGAIRLAPGGEATALRRPQIGALHAVLGYWTSGLTEPGIVVMPTGTGKTDTMIALMVTCRPGRLLVVVPSSALRDQIAQKFESLGILQTAGIVDAGAVRPCVARLEHGFADPDQAISFAAMCNVLVTTPSAVGACSPEARQALLSAFTHLMVDEAHHAPARTWASIITAFEPKPTLLFTATPYREDGRPVPGRPIFRYPLREAQREGYFTHIDYQAVLSLRGTDDALADLAIARLRNDLQAGRDHILMARAKNISRAEELAAVYTARAPELGPAVLHDRLPGSKRAAVMEAIRERRSRIIICVDMLGEGFDLPALKIAAIHDVKKSLSPMIQLIGRFTRTDADARIGTASVFVARNPSVALSPLRDLLREDPDWDLILRDITERVTEAAEKLSAFESSFTGTPEDVVVTLLEPKMSAIAYRAATGTWDPDRAAEVHGLDNLLDGRISTGAGSTVAWFVLEHRSEVRWGSVPALEQLTYELIIMYFDEARRVLYIYGSDNAGNYSELADAVLGSASTLINGPTTFRVLARLDRLIPTNVGLLDARDHFNRFSMHVGSDVLEALDTADRQGKSQTHIATSGFDEGERVSISAALSGRFWSMRAAPNLKAWTDWCDEQGTKLLDDSIDLRQVLSGFIIPVDLTERPPHVLLGLEWPWPVFTGISPGVLVSYADLAYPITDIGLEVDDHSTSGPFRFSLVTPAWRLWYTAEFGESGLTYSPVGDDAQVASRPAPIPMSTWINKNKPTLFLEGDRMITPEDRLLVPRYDLPPYDRGRFRPLEWTDVNIQVESQGTDRRQDSIQAYMSAYLQKSDTFDVLIDDDRAGEAADLVGARIDGSELIVTLVHCKYSSKPTPGARLDDLYELCGQAIRGAKWRQQGTEPLLRHLDRRAQRYASRTGESPYEVGTIDDLYRVIQLATQLRPRFRTIIAQPGLSAAACTREHLQLLAGAESYIRAVTKGTFDVYCSK